MSRLYFTTEAQKTALACPRPLCMYSLGTLTLPSLSVELLPVVEFVCEIDHLPDVMLHVGGASQNRVQLIA